ncbi:TGF-beta-activated kinase 1 and MAP3K7-binding protein 2-like isoform X2 [Toxorhynchites rutilus septentrionalis]|nr:TGF-beta-activated kinase 1 and MAP3K7-binding protein 2-like isoform X2 [Toxorhynchites rutilus septentrionalis]XP_055621640.1 TGF-beta-activated kinase 1 and MAP3K7-binding protein 2-like isoform X2 [Toxorhynchites rutilus septentrionalis]
MATNRSRKPPEHDTSTESYGPNITNNNNSSSLLKQRRSSCSCSNIAIMQLFHEMKQKFPTVPDHVVSDLVTANCHNRPACIDSLEKAVLGTPAAVQAYPSQSIHSTSLKRRINERKLNRLENNLSGGSSGSSSRESSVDKIPKCAGGTTGSSGTNFANANNNNRLLDSDDITRDGFGSANNTDNRSATTAFDNNNNRIALSRPNTLAFSGPRPTRVAPLPPISSTITASPELGETVNVQLNVTVSPVAGRSPVGQRHTSTLQLQPEPPYSRELAQASSSFNTATPQPPGGNGRSSTSVNLTLRQPTDSPQSPIHIHASPLKYTAKGFNAQSGIQSKLEITFRDGFGSISAMRTHVPGYDPSPSGAVSAGESLQQSHLQELPHWDQTQLQQQMTQNLPTAFNAGSAQFAASNESDGLDRQQLYQNYLTEIAITHQVGQKNRLCEEVDRYRQQLGSIQREIRVLKQPISRIDVDFVSREVQLLEEEVDRMQKEVDSAELMGPNQIPVASVADGLSALNIEGFPSVSTGPIINRPPRPPRPPPPKFPPNHPPAPTAAAVSTSYTIEGRYSGRSNSTPAAIVAGMSDSAGVSGASTGEQWTCSLCTFQNHELMTRCEVCSLPKMPGRLSSQCSAPAASSSSSPSPSPLSSSASPISSASTPPVTTISTPPVATTVLLQSSASSSSVASIPVAATSTPQSQSPPSIQNAQYQKSSIEC